MKKFFEILNAIGLYKAKQEGCFSQKQQQKPVVEEIEIFDGKEYPFELVYEDDSVSNVFTSGKKIKGVILSQNGRHLFVGRFFSRRKLTQGKAAEYCKKISFRGKMCRQMNEDELRYLCNENAALLNDAPGILLIPDDFVWTEVPVPAYRGFYLVVNLQTGMAAWKNGAYYCYAVPVCSLD